MSWKYLYKTNYDYESSSPTNMISTPSVNNDGHMLKIQFDKDSPYQQYNKNLSAELVSFFFNKELDNLIRFQGESWCPKLIDTDRPNQTFFIEFNVETLNKIVTDKSRDLTQEYPNFKSEMEHIITSLDALGYRKMSLYPHCFFIGMDNRLKTIDFYACLPKGEMIKRSFIEGIIGTNSLKRFDYAATVDGYINFDMFFEYTMKYQLSHTWGTNNIFPELYEKLND